MDKNIRIEFGLLEDDDVKIENLPPAEENIDHFPLQEVCIDSYAEDIPECESPILEFEIDESEIKTAESNKQSNDSVELVQDVTVAYECYECKHPIKSIPAEENIDHFLLQEVCIDSYAEDIPECESPILEFEIDESEIKTAESNKQSNDSVELVQDVTVAYECYECKHPIKSIPAEENIDHFLLQEVCIDSYAEDIPECESPILEFEIDESEIKTAESNKQSNDSVQLVQDVTVAYECYECKHPIKSIPAEENIDHFLLQEVCIDSYAEDIPECESPILEFEIDESEIKTAESNKQSNDSVQLVQDVTVAYECYECKRPIKYIDNLRRHLYKHWVKRKSNKTFDCNVCGKICKTNNYLKTHIRRKHEEWRFECDKCLKKFTYESDLKRHLITHSTDRPFSCSHCAKSFITSFSLTQHIRIHTGEKPFQCNECLKRFFTSGALKNHKFVHTDARPFSCKVCAKLFKSKHCVRQHMRIHEVERKFTCVECSQEFKSGVGLKIHMRIHTGEKPFACTYCPKAFSLKDNMKRHLRVHTGEKPYACDE